MATERSQSDLLRLADAARAAGVSVQQLQYYLMVGLVEASAVSSGRQRLFDRRAVKRIRMIKLLNDSGYGLRDIREIFLAPPRRRRKSETKRETQ